MANGFIKNKVVISLGIIIVLVAAAVAGFYYTRSKKGPSRGGPGGGGPGMPVELVTVAPELLEEKLTTVGTVLSNESVTIKPEVAGKIISIGFEEGEQVEEGTVLFELDSELIGAEYEEVKADYDFAEAQFKRAQQLQKDGIMPVEEYDNRRREFLRAQSRLNNLATKLRKHKITAPSRGKASSRKVSIGDYVSIGEELVRIEDLSVVKVEFYVPQRYIQRVSMGQAVRVKVEPFPATYEGTVYLIDPQVDPNTRSAVVRAKVPNPKEVLLPGMFCTTTVVIDKKENALLIPEAAVISRGKSRLVYIEKDGKAEQREVALGLYSEGRVEVLTGLNPGDRVVKAGWQKIGPGTPITEEKGDAEPPGQKGSTEQKG